MKDELFEELLESVREGGPILTGDAGPSRRYQIEEPDVAAVRERYGLSQ
jgi:putative transcriptional regulator